MVCMINLGQTIEEQILVIKEFLPNFNKIETTR